MNIIKEKITIEMNMEEYNVLKSALCEAYLLQKARMDNLNGRLFSGEINKSNIRYLSAKVKLERAEYAYRLFRISK